MHQETFSAVKLAAIRTLKQDKMQTDTAAPDQYCKKLVLGDDIENDAMRKLN